MKFEIFYILTILHYLALGGLALYGLHRIWFLICWFRIKRLSGPAAGPAAADFLPGVTVQLPLYNERFVGARLLDAACRLDWPLDRLHVQVLDDSDDDTCRIVDERAAYWGARGVDIRVLRRSNRDGFKAGALAGGLSLTSSPFIAVFDADFLPPEDFLRRTVPCFSDPRVGMVQARWGFLNKNNSWFSRMQALLLAPHFRIEQLIRFRRGLFFNFNGTAGIWRRAAIESSGGWQADTVTEDLDLSYRAQLADWRFIYLDDLEVPSELPTTISAFLSQQRRWAKGSLQTAKKILPRLFASPMPLVVKIEAAVHLLSNLGWLFGALITLTLYPALLCRVGVGPRQILHTDLPLFLFAAGAILLYFFVYTRGCREAGLARWLPLLPVFAIGVAPNISFGVLQGIFCKGGIFKRTPKFGVLGRERLPAAAFIYKRTALPCIGMAIVFLIYCLLPLAWAIERKTWFAVPLVFMFPLGFFMVVSRELLDAARGGVGRWTKRQARL